MTFLSVTFAPESSQLTVANRRMSRLAVHRVVECVRCCLTHPVYLFISLAGGKDLDVEEGVHRVQGRAAALNVGRPRTKGLGLALGSAAPINLTPRFVTPSWNWIASSVESKVAVTWS